MICLGAHFVLSVERGVHLPKFAARVALGSFGRKALVPRKFSGCIGFGGFTALALLATLGAASSAAFAAFARLLAALLIPLSYSFLFDIAFARIATACSYGVRRSSASSYTDCCCMVAPFLYDFIPMS